uniref:PAP-associated domain-containing protein n=1 Tax=Steinernema glaseri TaxID=37863 RepID=A0A1I7Y4Q4_9BILA
MFPNASYKQLVHLFSASVKVNISFNTSKGSKAECARFQLANGVPLFYCECRLVDFFPSYFVGCGFGRSDRHSRWAACRDLVDVLLKASVLTESVVDMTENLTLNVQTKAERNHEWKEIGKRFTALKNLAVAENLSCTDVQLSPEAEQSFKECLERFKQRVDVSEKNAACAKKRKQEVATKKSPEGPKAARKEDEDEPPKKRANLVEIEPKEVVVEEGEIVQEGVLAEDDDIIILDSPDANDGTTGAASSKNTLSSPVHADMQDTVASPSKKQDTVTTPAEKQDTVASSAEKQATVATPAKKQDAPEPSNPPKAKFQQFREESDSEESYISLMDEPEVIAFNSNFEKCLSSNARKNTVDVESDEKLYGDIGVTTMTGFLHVYDQIDAYKKRFPKEFDNFNSEIWKHFELNGQNDMTFAWKMRAREMIHHVIRGAFPDSQLVVVGSTLNGCGSFNSDLDMCLCVRNPQGYYDDNRAYGVKILRRVWTTFKNLRPPFMKDLDFISKAKVPILKLYLHPPYDELEIDINCNNTAGIYNTHLMHNYSRIDDRFGALCLLIKHWAINNKIQDAMTGTFNSYSLILMVLHFLQTACSPPVLPNLQFLFKELFNGEMSLESLALFEDLPPWPRRKVNKQPIGELLIAFFDYYSNFDFDHIGISVHRGSVFHRHDLPESSERFKLYIEEPFDGQNTARCITKEENFTKILNAILKARNAFLGKNAKAPTLRSIGI